jgi:hypothetical protein
VDFPEVWWRSMQMLWELESLRVLFDLIDNGTRWQYMVSDKIGLKLNVS